MNRLISFSFTKFASLLLILSIGQQSAKAEDPNGTASVVGVTIVPHRVEESMRYRRPRDPSLAARVQLFVMGAALPGKFDGKSPTELLESGDWAWHDMSAAVKPPPGAMTVWSFNGKSSRWGVGQEFQLSADGLAETTVKISEPMRWISAVTFLSSDEQVQPDTIVASRRKLDC